MGTEFVTTCKVEPDVGSVTWASEGTEGGFYHSRKLHVPTSSSGLTIGRGYDMKQKLSANIINDLTKAGVTLKEAQTISAASGLSGDEAKRFIIDNKLEDFEIEQCVQKELFDISYQNEVAETHRLCEKADVTEKYGKCEWDKLDSAIQEILVDLKFRGDYTPSARTIIQKHVSSNDLESFAKEISNIENWSNVPKDRFEHRKSFINKALSEKKAR